LLIVCGISLCEVYKYIYILCCDMYMEGLSLKGKKNNSIIHSRPHKSLVVYLHKNVNVIIRKEIVFHMCLLNGK
jgi:hypothetical protein